MGCIQSKIHRRHHHRRRRRWCCDPHPISEAERSIGDPAPLHHHHLLTGSAAGSAAVPAANLALNYSSLAQRGHYPESPDRLNQDSFLIKTNLQSNPNLHLFAVFDGHGQFGTECAEFVKGTLARILENDPDLAQNPAKSFAAAFESTNALLRASDIDDSMSGTTAIAVLVCAGSLYVANVGDSRAVAGILNPERNCVVAENLSCDQTPFRKDEYARVRKCGARVLSVDQVEGTKDPEVQSWGDEESDDGDPPRLWVQDGMYPGTAFTRSVGDATAEGIGVIALPEVKEVKISADHLFFVVASDGVFEFLSSQAVVNMVVSFKDPRDACAAIAAESYKTWLEHETRTDDITLIIVHIKDMSNLDSADEVSQISLRPSPMTSEEGYRFQSTGTGTFHARRGSSITELQAFSDFTATERNPACVAPSPEQTLSFKTVCIDETRMFGSSCLAVHSISQE